MATLSIINLLRNEELCYSVDLFGVSHSSNFGKETAVTSNEVCGAHKRKVSPCSPHPDKSSENADQRSPPFQLSVVVDGECCLDRLYGGYYSDWASGGQWNRMLFYIGNLAQACKTNGLHITIAFRGGVEKEHAEELFRGNKDFRERLNRVLTHLLNRGTPPPKVWWLPPTCLREAICLAMQVYGKCFFALHLILYIF